MQETEDDEQNSLPISHGSGKPLQMDVEYWWQLLILRRPNGFRVCVTDVASVFILIRESLRFAKNVERPANARFFLDQLIVGEHAHISRGRHTDAGAAETRIRRPLLVVIAFIFHPDRDT